MCWENFPGLSVRKEYHMDLSKSYEFLKPDMVTDRIHIIGCGAVGSTLAENLARFGLTKITLHDFDTVEPKNIANQMFTAEDIGSLKVDALARYLQRINPMIKNDLTVNTEGWKPTTKLTGHVFLCVDSIDLRREITEACFCNPLVKTIWDWKPGLLCLFQILRFGKVVSLLLASVYYHILYHILSYLL